MYHFFVRVFAEGISPTPTAPLTVTFDEAYERCSRLPGLFIEPDGAFVWCAATQSPERWRLEGCLYDRGESLFYVELKGVCAEVPLQALLDCLHSTGENFAFEWVERGIITNESTFREISRNNPSA